MPEEILELENQDSRVRTRREPLDISFIESNEMLPLPQQQPILFFRKTNTSIQINGRSVI